MPPNLPDFGPSIIDRAPTSIESTSNGKDLELAQLRNLTAKLSEELNSTKSELEKFKGVSEVDAIKANLITPYATNIFRFMCFYTFFVGLILMFRGFKLGGFEIDDNVLMVLAGTTALAVIGLVKIVVSGLFNIKG